MFAAFASAEAGVASADGGGRVQVLPVLTGKGTPKTAQKKAPRELDPGPLSAKPFGQCRGWREEGAGSCDTGYATDDIFFLEVCLYNQICNDRDELWRLDAGTPWQCRLNHTGYAELQSMLLKTPDWGAPNGLPPRCEKWCASHPAPVGERCSWKSLACGTCDFCTGGGGAAAARPAAAAAATPGGAPAVAAQATGLPHEWLAQHAAEWQSNLAFALPGEI